jgi:hemolysin activation/secretion protein
VGNLAGLAIVLAPASAVAQQPGTATLVKSAHWSSTDKAVLGEATPKLDQELAAVVGQSLTNPQLADLLNRMTEAVQQTGLVVGQAGLMASDLDKFRQTGDLEIRVFPGKVGAVRLKNSSRVNNGRIERTATEAICPEGLGQNCFLTAAKLERMQLLIQDLPGVRLEPLTLNGSTDVGEGQTAVELTTTPGQKLITGSVGVDNYGIAASGQYRLAFGATVTDLLGFGDVFTATGSITDKATLSGSLGASAPLGYNGLRGAASYGHSIYSLPDGSGSADSGHVGLIYPLKRGLNANWSIGLDGGLSESRGSTSNGTSVAPRDLYSANLTISGNSGDRVIQLGESYWVASAVFTHGWVTQQLAGGDTTGVLGDYDKLKVYLTRRQNLGESKFYMLADFRGQGADRNLDFSEKLPIGGITGVRAYRADEGSFDAGGTMGLELRRLFELPNGDRLAPGIVLDGALGWFNVAPWNGWQTTLGYFNPTLGNFRAIAGAGPSIDWVSHMGFTASLTWAIALPGSPGSINYPGATNQFLASLGFRF